MGGVRPAAVATNVSHSTVQMTMQYAHLMPVSNILTKGVVDAFYLAEAYLRESQTDD